MDQPTQLRGVNPPYRGGQGARVAMRSATGGSRAVNVAAGVASLMLVGALGAWAYGQVQRDVSGVPVVRALEGPMREAPTDPGGQVAEHAGLSVNGVQAAGSAAAPADQISLAQPVTRLADEDLPQAALRPAPAAPTTVMTEAAPEDAPAPVEPADAVARALALAEHLTKDAEPLAAPTQMTPQEAVADAVADVLADPVVLGPGVTRSPRPAPRPLALPKAGIVDTSAPPTGVAELERVDPGTRLVQLGAFDSPDDARDAWGQIDRAVTGLLVDKSRLIQQAEAGGRTFWRLRVHGFTDLSEARRFCAAVSVASNDCIPVVAR